MKISKKIWIPTVCVISALAIAFTSFFIIRQSGENSKANSSVSNISYGESSVISSSSAAESAKEKFLEITNPAKTSFETTEPEFTFKGTCDGEFPVFLNEKKLENTEKGVIQATVTLKYGKNIFKFNHKEKDYTYTINYKYTLIKSVSPAKKNSYSGESTITVNATARSAATVTATFMGKTITLKKSDIKDVGETASDTESFSEFGGTFTLPKSEKTEKNLGRITVKASFNNLTESKNTGVIMLKKIATPVSSTTSTVKTSDPSVTPTGGKYMDVGSGLIATVIVPSAETFDGNTTDDLSRPTNNYLPKGTMDYCAEKLVYNGEKSYYKLRCGRRIYKETYPTEPRYNQTVAKITKGTLPDHNEIGILSFTQSGQFQYLKLNTLWKAPFYFDILNQKYTSIVYRDYTFDKVTYSYIDITFCYATVLNGSINIEKNNPLFSSAEIIKNKNDYTIRLHLKKVGGFYGWYAYYDNDGKLVFKFLNPAKMENPNSLKGIKIFIDVGHGGIDKGATSCGGEREAPRNLYLATVLKSKLEKLGATVIIDRTTDKYISPPDRMELIRKADADFCISIHHDYWSSSSSNGFGSYHFTPVSKVAADLIKEKMDATGLFKTKKPVKFHYFYNAKVTNCPVVLTENGFMSNPTDYANIISESANNKKAIALSEAILEYFRSIQ